ncbi:MAG: GGDEF domain-containing protein [Fimbriimonadales bacterium]|nr:GGDEF domain-containing protein [Fimbriimonadales bacterium]
MWLLRAIGLAALGGILWQKHSVATEWAFFGALALGALGASLVERRRMGLSAAGLSLASDDALAAGLFWALGGASWAYWLFVIPLLNALARWGAQGAFLSAPFSVGAISGGWLWLKGELIPSDLQPLSWAVGLAALAVLLGWAWRRRERAEQSALIQQAEQAVAESEASERRVRESYRELAHHYRRLEEHLEQLQDEAELLQALHHARDPDAIYRALLERLRARFEASGAALYLTDDTGARLQAACAIGALAKLSEHAHITPMHPFQHAPALQQAIDQLRAAALCSEQLAVAHGASPERPNAIVLPLQCDGRVQGVIVLTTRAQEGFSAEARTRLRALTPYLTGLLALTEQLRLMSVRLAETQFLYDVENLLFSAETAQSLPQRALSLLRGVTPYEHAQLILKRNQTLEIAAQFGELPDMRAFVSRSSTPIPAQLIAPEDAAPFAPARSALIAPLRGGVRTEGALILGRTELPPFNEADLELVQTLAFQLTTVLERAQLLSDLERLATTDGLTGLYNYRHFQERYREEVNLCRRYQHPLTVMLIDLDGFKQVNDTYGHLEGDYLLVQLAEVLTHALRNTEFIARYGGDEFVVLMHATNLQGGIAAAKRVVQAVRETEFLDTMGQARLKISVSIGVAAYPNSTENPAEVLEKADEALDIAKRSGRNQVVALENTA